jgi:hypothetical protein
MSDVAVRVIAFFVGVVAAFAIEVAIFFGWQWLFGGNWHPIGPGWALMPFFGGAGAAARATEWLGEIDRRRTLLRSRQGRAQRLGPGWQGNPVKGLKPPLGKRWQIVDTWPPSRSADTPPQMVPAMQQSLASSLPQFREKAETVPDSEGI